MSYSWPIHGIVKRVTRKVPLVEPATVILEEDLNSSPILVGFVVLKPFFLALSCSFSNSGFWLLLLVSSNFSFFYFQNKQTMSFLRGIGSNTSINCFALNLKNGQQVNPDVDICSKLNSEMYLRLSSFDNRRTCKRIPLLLARSYVDEEKYGICVVQLKNALGVSITVSRINSMRY